MSNTTTRTPNFCPYCERRTSLAHKPSCPTQILAQLHANITGLLAEIKSELAAGDALAAGSHADNLADVMETLSRLGLGSEAAAQWNELLTALSDACDQAALTDAEQICADLADALGELAA